MSPQTFSPNSFQTFGDLLKYLRRREHLTQLELSIIVGYSEAQIGRLEKNQRRPDLTTLQALFIPALHLDNDPVLSARFLELAESARQEDAPTPGMAPYKGLLFFDEVDVDLFFGREALTAHLADRVTALTMDASNRLLTVVGASGSGKSSLVRAGLAVALRHAGWDVRIFTPGANPLRALEMQLDRDQAGAEPDRFLIVADQFEEVFTLCRDESERAGFIKKLIALAQHASHKTTVVLTLRADFYSHCAQYPALRTAVAAQQEYIGQMTTDELRRAIEEPARYGKWEFEPGLVDVLLQDIGADGAGHPEPGALPLLSHALLATWERRRGRTFTLDGYYASGGVHGAIAETAESVFTDQLNREQQELAQAVFLRLTELGEGTEDTRRRAALNELVNRPGRAPQLRAVLNTLAEARLVTLNEDSAEVAHEALIREWRRLHEWLTQDREGLKMHRHLTDSAREWEALGHDTGALYRGARLAQAREWTAANEERLNETERAFLEASIEHEHREALEREAQHQRELAAIKELAETQRQFAARLQIRNRIITTIGSIAVILALLAGMFGLQSNQNAITAQTNFIHAQAQRLAAESNSLARSGSDMQLSALLAIRSVSLQPTLEGHNALVAAAEGLRMNIAVRQFIGHTDEVYAVVFSPDGKYALTGSNDGTARLWDVQTGQELRQLTYSSGGVSSAVLDVAFSRDGRYVLTGNMAGAAQVWDAQTGKKVGSDLIQGSTYAWGVAFSPDDRYVLTSTINAAILWDPKTGKQLRSFSRHTDFVKSAVFSSDGNFIATASDDGTARLWDAQTGQELWRFTDHTAAVSQAVFSPDDRYVFTGSSDTTARLLDARTGEELRLFVGHTDRINNVAFSPDGNYVLTASGDKTARLWNVRTGHLRNIFTSHGDAIYDIAFSPDGGYILTGSRDGTVWLWDVGGELPQFVGHRSGVNSVAFSPDGKYLLTSSLDQTARLWEAQSGQPVNSIRADVLNGGVAFSPDGKYMLTGSLTGTWGQVMRLSNTQTGEEVQRFVGHGAAVTGVAFSPDGRFVASANNDATARLWDAQTGKQLLVFAHTAQVYGVVFSPDGRYVLTGSWDKTARLWDIQTGKELQRFTGHADNVNGVAFSPDGNHVATASHDHTALLWDAQTGEELRQFIGHTAIVWSVALSPDGKYLLTASDDKTARLWDAQTGEELRRFAGHVAGVEWAVFSPDGRYIATASGDGTARLWDIDQRATMEYLCTILLRDFTDAERRQYNITDHTPTCAP